VPKRLEGAGWEKERFDAGADLVERYVRAGKLQVELIVEEQRDEGARAGRVRAVAQRPLHPKRRPTDAEVDGLVAAALDSNAAIRGARARYGTSCEVRFRGPLRPPREPVTAEKCVDYEKGSGLAHDPE
jgi:hypothetical protein